MGNPVSLLIALPNGVWYEEESAALTMLNLDELPLPGIHTRQVTYRVDPYLAAASQLQALGRDEALRQLADFGERHRYSSAEGNSTWRTEPLFVLCRMLFVARGSIPFRAPALGFSGGDPKLDPLEPLHIVDGVPFLTFQNRYSLFGVPEDPEHYLLYCITHCDWSSYRFIPRSMAEKRAALERLSARRELDSLKLQIENP